MIFLLHNKPKPSNVLSGGALYSEQKQLLLVKLNISNLIIVNFLIVYIHTKRIGCFNGADDIVQIEAVAIDGFYLYDDFFIYFACFLKDTRAFCFTHTRFWKDDWFYMVPHF